MFQCSNFPILCYLSSRYVSSLQGQLSHLPSTGHILRKLLTAQGVWGMGTKLLTHSRGCRVGIGDDAEAVLHDNRNSGTTYLHHFNTYVPLVCSYKQYSTFWVSIQYHVIYSVLLILLLRILPNPPPNLLICAGMHIHCYRTWHKQFILTLRWCKLSVCIRCTSDIQQGGFFPLQMPVII